MKRHWNADDWHEYLCGYLDARANFPDGLNTVALQISDAINALLGRNAKLTEALKQMEGFALTPPLRRLVDDALMEGEAANDYNSLLTSWAECRDLLTIERDKTLSRDGAIKAIVHTAGGLVEGYPTTAINILQRIRQLVKTEEAVNATNDSKVRTLVVSSHHEANET